jgi:hypothetical protein
METDEETIKAVEKVLKEPVAAEFSEQAWKIRMNLTLTSAIAVVMCLANLRITADSSILGLKFSGLSDGVIRVTLFAIVAYLLVHFVWVAWDAFFEWRLRITGTRVAFQTSSFFAPDHIDSPSDPRQSTLYNWWADQQASIGNVGQRVGELEATCKRWESDLQKLCEKPENIHAPTLQNMTSVIHVIAEARERAAKIIGNVESNTKAITDARIPVSLKRFDDWMHLFQRSQNLRWFVIEFSAPIAFAFYALWLLQR